MEKTFVFGCVLVLFHLKLGNRKIIIILKPFQLVDQSNFAFSRKKMLAKPSFKNLLKVFFGFLTI